MEKQTSTPCIHCGREEAGKWFTPCPADDCPSHDEEKIKCLKQQNKELVEALTSLLIWDDGNLPGDLIDAARKAVSKAQGEGNSNNG